MGKYYKAYDFKTGKTYLIGAHESKADARAYCKEQGIYPIGRTVRAVPEKEYFRLLQAARRGDQ